MNFEKFKKDLFEYAEQRGFTDYSLYIENAESFNIKIFKQQVDEFKNSQSGGVSFSGIYNGKMGNSYAETLDETTAQMLVDSAKVNAKLIENEDEVIIFKGSENYKEVKQYELDTTDVEKKVQLAKDIEKQCFMCSDCVKKISYCVVGNGKGGAKIFNSKGLELEENSHLCYAVVSVVVEKNDDNKIGTDFWIGRSFDDFSPIKLATGAVNKGRAKLGASSIESGTFDIIIKNEAMSDLLASFASIFYAENVQKGFSVLKGKLQQNIASEKVTICDYGFYKDSIANSSFDSEGVATTNLNILENGVLKTYLHNLKTAKKDGVNPTGNGFKSSYKTGVLTRPTHFFIKNGDIECNQLIKNLKNGLIIDDISGLHAGTNTVTGDFSLLASGFLVFEGEVIRPIDQITIAGNFLELLKNIEYIGNDFKFDMPSGATRFGSPSVLVKNISVAGK